MANNSFNLTHFSFAVLTTNVQVKHNVIAPGKAQRIFRGESPRRVRVSPPPVSSVDLIAEQATANNIDEVSVHREFCRP